MKYLCNSCQKPFELPGQQPPSSIQCPLCADSDIGFFNTPGSEVLPPPWEFICLECKSKFRVPSPSGPDEARAIRCPVCQKSNLKWLALISETCPAGG